MPRDDLLRDLDRYLDAAPRSDADALEAGPFTLFVGRGESSYYARPRHGPDAAFSAADVVALEAACAERDVELAIEWIGEMTPSLEPAARAAGLAVERHVLLVLAPADLRPVEPPDGFSTELLVGDDPRLVDARAVAEVAFGVGGTSIGGEGPAERDERLARTSEAMRAYLADRSARELTLTAVAADEDGVQAVGSLQPAGGVAEILAVATLPTARRRGLAAALTSGLVQEAGRRRLRLVLLSAADEDVARVYERVGFGRVGTHLAAEGAMA